jgi:hypothetical protein
LYGGGVGTLFVEASILERPPAAVMLSYIKERFHGGYIPTGLQEGWMGVQTAFAEKDPVRRIFFEWNLQSGRRN